MIYDARDKDGRAELLAAIAKDAAIASWSYDVIGVRVDDQAYRIGDVLPESRIWIDGEPTDGRLAGTSAMSLRSIADYIDHYPACVGRYVYLLGGYSEGSGDDEGEIIIGRATVIDRYER